jgi:hypothetical protein
MAGAKLAVAELTVASPGRRSADAGDCREAMADTFTLQDRMAFMTHYYLMRGVILVEN